MFDKRCLVQFKLNRTIRTLQSIPTVDMKDPDKKAPSLNRTKRHVLPTPESPSNMTYKNYKIAILYLTTVHAR